MDSELGYARFVAEGLSHADLAHCVMLYEQGIIPEAAARELLRALVELHEADPSTWVCGLTEGDLYDHRDAWLRRRLGETSGWLHTGRARREAVTLGWLLGLRHDGLALEGIVRAALVNLRAGEIRQGASTITQQLVRLRYLDPRRTWSRKPREAALATALEWRSTKPEILTSYLNEIYFGRSGDAELLGVGAAAWALFGKSPSRLELHESALLAALIAKLILDPTGPLAEVPAAVRVGATVLGFVAYVLSGNRLFFGVATAEAALFAGWFAFVA